MPSNKINEIRMIKSSNEINKIKKVAKITTQTYEYISSIIKPGLTERDVANEIDFYGRKSGAQQLAYETKVTSGERTALPNAETSDRVIKDKELVTVKFAFEIDGYTSEIAHTLAVGDVKKELKELLDVAQKAQAFGCRFANKVETFGDLDRIIRGYVIDAGYGEFLDHVTGHGIGLNAIDNPIIRTSNNDQVQSFIPFIIEPGVYIPGKGGAIMEGQYYLDKNNKIICLNI
jgi:Xaa-Pro aminopeptidase